MVLGGMKRSYRGGGGGGGGGWLAWQRCDRCGEYGHRRGWCPKGWVEDRSHSGGGFYRNERAGCVVVDVNGDGRWDVLFVDDKKMGWELPGGGMKYGDASEEDRARRELVQEVGIKVELGVLTFIGETVDDRCNGRKCSHHRTVWFLLRWKGGNVGGKEVMVKWMGEEQINEEWGRLHVGTRLVLETLWGKIDGELKRSCEEVKVGSCGGVCSGGGVECGTQTELKGVEVEWMMGALVVVWWVRCLQGC